MNATTDLRKMNKEELIKEKNSILGEQFNLNMQKGSGQLSKPHLIKKARKDVARINMMISELERNND